MDLTVIIPAFNEAENLPVLISELKPALEKLRLSYEILILDDGSTDDSFEVLKRIKENEKSLRAIKLRKNVGQTIVLDIAFRSSRGDTVVVMDADLQNDPSDIPQLYAKLKEGCDCVSGWRYNRADPAGKRLVSSAANWLRRMITGENVHDSGCSLKIYRKECLKDLQLFGEMHRFIPLLLLWRGFKVCEAKVNHRARKFGRTKYGALRVIRGLLDLLTAGFWIKYSTKPMHLFGTIGIASFMAGSVIGIYLVAMKILYNIALWGRPLLLLVMLLTLLGIQFFMLGIMVDIMVKDYYQHDKREYLIEKEI
ncbi:glycosyltransferase family 2 protein [Candidatus Woesearchaeota archaeon]|nr:glycosyltransferase family 2 protein [Candidatus Woesearchaeota archaeon]